jgi:hypothetical protein
MKVSDRPYSGNWSEDFVNKYRKTRSWTPDAIVTFNGETTLPGCPTCRNKIDFSRFITTVSASGGVDGSNGCDISLKIPWAYGDSVYKDGKFILVSGIEVFVYYRGFFQVKDLALKADNIDLDNGEILSAPDAETRPYYPVFHGVISGVDVSLTDGAYDVSISTRNMLSFWDNQQINTQQGYFAADPTMSRGSVNLRGHVYTGMTPHQVIYDLFLDAGGSAEGTGFALSKKSNIKARSSTGPQLYSLMIRYLEQRFKNGMYGLRMYGASGRMYSAIETQIVANKEITKGEKKAEFRKVITRQNKPYAKSKSEGISFSRMVKAGMLAFEHNNATGGRVQRTMDARLLGKVTPEDKTPLSVFQLKPFVPDLGSFAQIAFFESNMESKKAIADRVKEATGYEFYQDMDGDLVFKPPMYNMDTSSDRVYNIYREDCIDISFTHAEPEATYVTMKGSHFRNFNGAAPTGEWGVKGVYVDYALVAKYGWKGQDFDSSFYTNGRQAYYAAAVELDKQNKTTEGCSVTIPLRPEIKAGYPVYIEENDCFYYVESVNHSFSYGGSCTTSLTLTCQRKKFIPPGDSSVKYRDDPSRAVDLGRTELPERYLYKRYDRTDEGSRQINAQSQDSDVAYKKITGFPNVVMAFDHQNASPSMLFFTPDYQNIGGKGTKERERYKNMIINEGLRLGLLRVDAGSDIRKGPWKLMVPSADGSPPREVVLPLEGTDIKGTQKLKKISDKSRVAAEKAAKAIGKGGKSTKVQKARDAEADRLDGLQSNIQKAVGTAGVYGEQGGSNPTGTSPTATILDLIYLIQSPLGRNPSNSPLQNLMGALSDKKSSFVPKAQGYFRYYSSSHPSPEHQGPDLFEYKDSPGDVPELVFNDNIPETVRDNVVKAKPDGDGDTVMFGNDASSRGQIVRGLLTKTMYSNGLEYVPTKDITSLSFQVSGNFSVGHSTGPMVKTSQVWYQRGYTPGTEFWEVAYRSVRSALAKQLKPSTQYGSLLNYFNKEDQNAVTSILIPTEKRDFPVASWGSAEAEEYFEGTTPSTLVYEITSSTQSTLVGEPPVKHDSRGKRRGKNITNIKTLASHIASVLLYKLWSLSKEEYPKAYEVETWEKLVREENLVEQKKLTEQVTKFVLSKIVFSGAGMGFPFLNTINVSQTTFKVNKKGKTVTPIFPISDARGYEVFGAYQYGRGLKPSRGTLFDALLRQDPTQIFTPQELEDVMRDLDQKTPKGKLETKEQFRVRLKQRYVEKVMSLSAEDRDRLKVGLGLDGEVRDSEQNTFNEASELANRLMTRSDEQVISNIPSSLAEIYPSEDGNEVCECRIHSTDAILLEGSLDLDNFLEIENPALRGIRNMTEKKAVEWREHQTTLRGENVERINPGQGSFATSNEFGSGFDFNNRGNNRLLNSFTEINEDADTLQTSFRNPFAGAVSSASAGADQLSDQAKAIKAKAQRVGGDDNE